MPPKSAPASKTKTKSNTSKSHKGSTNWNEVQTQDLLNIVKELLPRGQDGWKVVAAEFKKLHPIPARDHDQCKRRFMNIKSKPIPENKSENLSFPESAREINELIKKQSKSSNSHEEEEEEDHTDLRSEDHSETEHIPLIEIDSSEEQANDSNNNALLINTSFDCENTTAPKPVILSPPNSDIPILGSINPNSSPNSNPKRKVPDSPANSSVASNPSKQPRLNTNAAINRLESLTNNLAAAPEKSDFSGIALIVHSQQQSQQQFMQFMAQQQQQAQADRAAQNQQFMLMLAALKGAS